VLPALLRREHDPSGSPRECGARNPLVATSEDPLMSSVITSASFEHPRSGRADDEILLDYRARCALEALEREAVKRHDYAELCSAENSADVRIRAWEKVHQLRMPATPFHPVLEVIAAATQLSLAEVRYEQQLRTQQRASADG
jgi:hypothetical protein